MLHQQYHPSKRRGSTSDESECSAGSGHTNSTAPTVYSVRPTLHHWDTDISQYLYNTKAYRADSYASSASASASASDDNESILTYASTAPSEADPDEQPEYQVYDEPLEYYETFEPTAYPATSEEFATYFPSTRRLNVRHDDTIDGNMNLRVDAEVTTKGGRPIDLTLFHLRMHDLKNREFSLRRYCRNSGREVCHSSRKYAKPASERRPALSRSMGSALASFMPKSSDARMRPEAALKRTDSGYDSMSDDEDAQGSGDSVLPTHLPVPTNTTNIEFSNYAHVELKRRGAKSSKRYEFGYWGRDYTWRRVVRKVNATREVSYHLYDSLHGRAVAHVVPVTMSPDEADEEESKGGWIPPCSLWISDLHSFGRLADVADVIVATGLMALVDDCIKQRWHRKDRFQLQVPLPALSSKKLNMEYIGPKRLIDEVFNRRAPHDTRRVPSRQVTA